MFELSEVDWMMLKKVWPLGVRNWVSPSIATCPETEWKCVYTASLERMDRILRWQTALSQQFGASQQTKFEEICLKWRNNLAIVPEAGRALSIPSCPRETQTTKTKVASLILAQRRLQTQMAVSKRRLHARQNCGLAESMTSLQSRFRFVCGQKSTLEFGPKDLAHAQRSLRCVMDGIGQGVVGCGFAVYRFGSYLFGVWKLPVEPPRIKNNILEEGLPLAKDRGFHQDAHSPNNPFKLCFFLFH